MIELKDVRKSFGKNEVLIEICPLDSDEFKRH